MGRRKTSGRKPLLWDYILILAVFLSGNSYAGKITEAEIRIPDEGKISLILQAIEKAINKPGSYNLAVISGFTHDDEKGIIDENISYFKNSKEGFADKFNFGVYQQIWIKPKHITEFDTLFNVFSNVIYQINDLVYTQIIPTTIRKTGHRWKVDNLSSYLNAVNTFVDESRTESASHLTPALINKLPVLKSEEDYSSENMLCSATFYENQEFEITMPRFTTTESQEQFDCIIFGHPYDILPVKLVDTLAFSLFVINEFLLVIDPAWNRIIASDNYNDWLKAIGSFGEGAFQFKQPIGATYINPSIFVVADAYNYRASVYQITDFAEGSVSFITHLSNNNGPIKDVATGYLDYGNATMLAVLDWGNSRVDLYDVTSTSNFTFRRSIFSNGSGLGEIHKPTSICFAVDPISHFDTPHIYVADAGNNRIVRADTSFNDIISTNYEFPANAYLTSIMVDGFGAVYGVDKYNSKIYQFNSDLDSLIAIYGSKGDGDKELLYPISFKIAEMVDNFFGTFDKLPCRDAFVTEYFNANTGIRRFNMGHDILWHEISYSPIQSGGCEWIRLDWFQTGPTSPQVKVYLRGGDVDSTVVDSAVNYYLAGEHTLFHFPDNSKKKNGFYVFEIISNSAYGTNTIVFKDSVYVAYPEVPIDISANNCMEETVVTGPKINIYWDEANPYSYTHYDIYRNGAYLAYTYNGQQNYVDHDVQYGIEYKYKVRSRYEEIHYSDFSVEDSSYTSGFYPDAPSNVHVNRDNSTCEWVISWNDNSINEEEFYVHVNYTDLSGVLRNDHLYTNDSNVTSIGYYNSQAGVELYFNVYARDYRNCCVDPYGGEDCLLSSDPPATAATTVSLCEPTHCPFLYVWNNNQYMAENNILPASTVEPVKDSDLVEYHFVNVKPSEDQGKFKFQVRESASDITVLDHIRLYMLDRDIPEEIVIDKNSVFHTVNEKYKPTRVIDHRGRDVTWLVKDKDGHNYYSDGPGHLIIEFDELLPPEGIKIDEEGGGMGDPPIKGEEDNPDKSGNFKEDALAGSKLDVFVSVNDDWVLIETIYGLTYDSEPLYFPANQYITREGGLKLKYEWNVAYRTDQVAYMKTKRHIAQVLVLPISNAALSSTGDVYSILASSDDMRITLMPDDTLSFDFNIPTGTNTENKAFVLKLEGWYTVQPSSRIVKESISSDTVLIPSSFSFEQNFPNPANPSTTFRFSIPQTSYVKLEIYNILGQRVATLANDNYEPGIFNIEWNNADLGSGIYFAKFKAGNFTSSRKVVVLK